MASPDRVAEAWEFDPTNSNNMVLEEGFNLAVQDDAFAVVDGTDNTKRVVLSVGDLTTATTRTLTVTDASGLIPTYQMVRADATKSLGNTTNATAMFATSLTVRAGTSYRFRLVWTATTGATSTTLSFLMAGTASLTTINYVSQSVDAAANTAAASLMNNGVVATAVVVGAAGTGVNKRIHIEGELEVNAGGTIIPQIKFSADPTGACTTNVGSFFEVWETGLAPVTTIGAFA